jgi:phosphate/sulfate permease
MELDELKKLLNQKLETDHMLRSEQDFAILLQQKANSLISKIRRSLRFEIISCVVILLIFAAIGFTSKYDSLRIYFVSFTILFLPFTYVFVYLMKKTNQVNHDTPLRTHLQSIVTILEEFVKRYFQFTMALIPVCFIFSFILGYNEKQPITEIDSFISKYNPKVWVIITGALVYFVGLSIGLYYFTKWYLRKLYGKYILQLKACIAELGEEE